ncbi:MULTISPECIES: hypothetical protein [Sphingosinicellaceae]|uniref:hypothetical protein n=1 Tax=Sphingosinicellaceae TaxID=2820280 RepID=UPI001C1E1856|nr:MULTISPECIES: hypothetical protein [Polymorphobacter]QYE33022.1 hypothetical protein KZX46_02475 [Polymorphobacter sp. PAMC 29334]UAJ12262.1 hypothetical protein KTC28_20750 [Polymorphobacter megasporae]
MTAEDLGCIGIRSDRNCGTSPESGEAVLTGGLMDEPVVPRHHVWLAMQLASAAAMLLLIILQLSFGPGTSQICARLENVACGP